MCKGSRYLFDHLSILKRKFSAPRGFLRNQNLLRRCEVVLNNVISSNPVAMYIENIAATKVVQPVFACIGAISRRMEWLESYLNYKIEGRASAKKWPQAVFRYTN